MATLSDENTQNIFSNIKELMKLFSRILMKQIIKYLDNRADQRFSHLEKHHSERIRTSDLESKDLDKFKILAQQNGIKTYRIEEDKHKTPTLKYDVKDEHKIIDIHKQLEEGYKIPNNELQAFMEKYIDTEQTIQKIKNFTSYSYSEIEKELKDPKNYREEELLNQSFSKRIQNIYEEKMKEVTGKETSVDLEQEVENINNREQGKDELDKRVERLRNEKPKTQTKGKEKEQNKEVEQGIER